MGFISESETQSVIDNIRNTTILLALIALVIGIAIALIISKLISGELRKSMWLWIRWQMVILHIE